MFMQSVRQTFNTSRRATRDAINAVRVEMAAKQLVDMQQLDIERVKLRAQEMQIAHEVRRTKIEATKAALHQIRSIWRS